MAASTIVVKLRTARFDELAEEQGWKTDAAIAAKLGLDPATVGRVRRGVAKPGASFIDACLRAFGATAYTDLFERES